MRALHFPLHFAACVGMAFAMALGASGAAASSADELSVKLSLLHGQLVHSPLKRPVILQASDTAGGLKGEVYAIVDHPMSEISTSLAQPAQWCEVMLLHINNRACVVTNGAKGPVITLSVVRKYDRPVDSAFQLAFDFRAVEATPRHLALRLEAPRGPLGTSNYRIDLEAIAVDATRSFLHFSYAYDENPLTAAAMQAYLATFGHAKVGFTARGLTADGQPDYIRGTHGLLERNAMRYFLTVDAYLGAHDALARRDAWFTASENYPLQLHEVDRATYLALKAADAHR